MAGHSIAARSGRSTLAQNALASKKKGKGTAAAKSATQAFSGGDQQVIETGQAQKDNTGRNAAIAASAFIPVVGPIIAATGAAVAANQDKKAAAGGGPNRPERRRLSAALEGVQANRDKGQRALATLSQAVFDWAATIR